MLSEVEEQLYPLHMQLLQQMEFHTVAECIIQRCVEEKKSCWQEMMGSVHHNLAKRVREMKQRHRQKLRSLENTQIPKKRDVCHALSTTLW